MPTRKDDIEENDIPSPSSSEKGSLAASVSDRSTRRQRRVRASNIPEIIPREDVQDQDDDDYDYVEYESVPRPSPQRNTRTLTQENKTTRSRSSSRKTKTEQLTPSKKNAKQPLLGKKQQTPSLAKNANASNPLTKGKVTPLPAKKGLPSLNGSKPGKGSLAPSKMSGKTLLKGALNPNTSADDIGNMIKGHIMFHILINPFTWVCVFVAISIMITLSLIIGMMYSSSSPVIDSGGGLADIPSVNITGATSSGAAGGTEGTETTGNES